MQFTMCTEIVNKLIFVVVFSCIVVLCVSVEILFSSSFFLICLLLLIYGLSISAYIKIT